MKIAARVALVLIPFVIGLGIAGRVHVSDYAHEQRIQTLQDNLNEALQAKKELEEQVEELNKELDLAAATQNEKEQHIENLQEQLNEARDFGFSEISI